ncbi:MAG: alcohol dehydrogenase catalytic domain-containing protein [Clostridiales Family XIII bacterium]|jgi:(R,R)-butanediol dehydrogenase/meso-butanediol dehydrogenase/diacetyl reductase|nr:alcohol dehydrogenase catalytic domain-containing protein [Clostridiales Family XIII bacterium]
MKAAVFYGKNDVRIEERPKPKAGPNQLVVKIDYVGLCGTDADAYKTGSFLKHGMVLGHENIGTVTELGAGVDGYAVGDRLICGPPTYCAVHCPPCDRGDTNICANALANTRGIGGPDGGYAEYMLVQDVKNAILVKLPGNVDPKEAVLFDVICVAIHAIRLSCFRPGDNVVVSGGGGPVGLSAVRLLRAAGARRIAVLQTGPIKRPKLLEFGADLCIDPNETDDIAGKLRDFFGTGEEADVCFECAGNKTSLYNCLRYCTRPGGQVVMVGQVTQPADNIVPSDFFVKEISIQPSFVFTAKDVNIYADMLSTGKISFPGMITGIIPLEECVEKGLNLPREERRKHIKILIDPSMR